VILIEERTHTALHVLKGAVQNVLGAKWTAGVFVQENHGRLTVQFERKPTDEEMEKIEEAANNKIKEDVSVEILEMGRKDAEDKFGGIIYDLFPLPEHIQTVKISNIAGWNLNCCNKAHVKTTGEIGKITLGKERFRENKKMLEIPFDVSD
jgi:alanyl-tRNA synthetase